MAILTEAAYETTPQPIGSPWGHCDCARVCLPGYWSVSTPSQARSTLIIGTRGSQLALWQAEWVQRQLKQIAPDLSVVLKRIQTSGDKIQDVPLAKVGGKGLFVKEIEEALLRKDSMSHELDMRNLRTTLRQTERRLLISALRLPGI